MPLQVLQRPHWHGTPIELGDLFRLQKNRRKARAALFTHQLDWEVRLLVGSQLEVVQTQACRDQEEVLATEEHTQDVIYEPCFGTFRYGKEIECSPVVRENWPACGFTPSQDRQEAGEAWLRRPVTSSSGRPATITVGPHW